MPNGVEWYVDARNLGNVHYISDITSVANAMKPVGNPLPFPARQSAVLLPRKRRLYLFGHQISLLRTKQRFGSKPPFTRKGLRPETLSMAFGKIVQNDGSAGHNQIRIFEKLEIAERVSLDGDEIRRSPGR